MSNQKYCDPKCPNFSVKSFKVERKIQRGDTTYDLIVGSCACGKPPLITLTRSCGSSLSVYHITQEQCDHLDDYIAKLHQSFAYDVQTKLSYLIAAIRDCNSQGFFEAEEMDVHHVRLIDKARLIVDRFAKRKILTKILQHPDDIKNDLVAAFLLGCLATENFWIVTHEKAVTEGYTQIEGRRTGRPLAVAARKRQGQRSRAEVIAAAETLYQKDAALRRNDTKTAMLISEMKPQALRKRDGTYLGVDAIIKHLREARRNERL
jgi:hypothetical protein